MSYREIRGVLIGRGSIYVGGRAAIVLVQVLALPLVTRALSPEEYGTVALSFIAAAVIGTLGDAGLPLAASRVYFDADRGPQRANALMGVILILGVAVAGIAHLTGDVWTSLFDALDYGPVLALGVSMAPPAMVRNAALGILRAQDKALAHSLVAVVSAAGGQAIGLILLIGAGLGAPGYLGGILIGSVSAAVIGWIAVGAGVALPRGDLGVRRVLRFSLPTVPQNVSTSLLNSGDRVIVERFSGLSEVGRYQVGYRVGSLAMVVTAELARALVPVVFDQERTNATIQAAQSVVVRITAWLAVGLAFSGPLLVRLIVPPEYSPIGLSAVVSLVAAASVPYAFGSVAGLGLVRVKRTRPLAWITLLSATLNLLTAALGAILFDLVGVAAATVVAFVVEAILVQRAVRTRTGIGRAKDGSVLWAGIAMLVCIVVAFMPITGLLWVSLRTFGIAVSGTWLLREIIGGLKAGRDHRESSTSG